MGKLGEWDVKAKAWFYIFVRNHTILTITTAYINICNTTNGCISTRLLISSIFCSLRLHIDIREMDTKSSLGSNSVPKEKSNLFKFRQNLDKILVIGVSQPDEGNVPLLRVAKYVKYDLLLL